MQGRRKNNAVLSAEELSAVRDALRESVAVTSLRSTARELKMSPTGLQGFIDGATPYVKTSRRARAWYAAWSFRRGATDEADEAAIGVLVSTIGEERRGTATEELRQTVARLRGGGA